MANEMRVLELFAGIGGFSLGLRRAGGFRTVCMVEIEPYCQEVLKARMADGSLDSCPIWDDVTDFDGTAWRGRIDCITGGFPCQDISPAGKRAGIEGEKSGLWSHYARIICEIRPRVVFVENVSALLTRGIGRVLGDLAEIGYDAEWDCLSAGAFGSHHLRDRTFILAHRSDPDILRSQGEWSPPKGSWTRKQFEGLVQAELQVSVPSGKSGGISHGVPNRMERLKALGNAVVPQVVEWIGRRIRGALE